MNYQLYLCLLLLVGSVTDLGLAQGPTHKDVPYDSEHKTQCLDAYLSKADRPTPAIIYIHGGGWRAGSKNNIPRWLRDFVTRNEASVISVEYRFTNVKTHPAQVNDCLRAIQFVRSKASEWNINPERIAVTGGSAGGHLSAYVALHDDAADADSADPIERQSSRVSCAVSFAGPTDWTLLDSIEHRHPAYRQLIGYPPGTPAKELKASLVADVSPITFASKDDPPVMQVHGDRDDIVPAAHAMKLNEKLKAVGVTSELVIIPGGNHGVAGAGIKITDRPTAFVRKHLMIP